MKKSLGVGLALMLVMVAQCADPQTGGDVGTHGDRCNQLGATEVRHQGAADPTTWKCEKNDEGNDPPMVWMRIK